MRERVLALVVFGVFALLLMKEHLTTLRDYGQPPPKHETATAVDDPTPSPQVPPHTSPQVPPGVHRVVHASSTYPLVGPPTCQLGSGLRQVLVVRICGLLTPELRRMYASYARELEGKSELDMWLLYDYGKEMNWTILSEFRQLQLEHPGLGLFLYNTAAVKAMLPTAEYILNDPTPNFWFHDASLFMWSLHCRPDQWKYSPFSPDRRRNEFYIWTVEPDSIYFGDVSKFLEAYRDNTADYIAALGPVMVRWYHENQTSWYPMKSKTLFKKQHVERHSSTLLRYEYSLAQLNVISYGEIYSSTVCNLQPDWCVMQQLDPRFIGPFYGWHHMLTDETVDTMRKDPAQHDRWNHAVASRKSQACHNSVDPAKKINAENRRKAAQLKANPEKADTTTEPNVEAEAQAVNLEADAKVKVETEAEAALAESGARAELKKPRRRSTPSPTQAQ